MPEHMGSISFSSTSLPRRRIIKSATVSSAGPLWAISSISILNFPLHDRMSDLMNAGGDSGRALSFPPEKMNLFFEFSLLFTGSIPRLLQSSRVFGLLSRNPFGPFSQRNPLT